MYELLRAIRQRECPKCGATDSMDIQLTYFCIVCKSCHAYYIDPFEKGPWDDISVLDTHQDIVVSSYLVENRKDEPELDLIPERAEFFRFIHKDAATRQVVAVDEEEGE